MRTSIRNKIIFSSFVFITYLIAVVFFEFYLFKYQIKFNELRILIYVTTLFFLLSNIIFDYKKIWKWIFKYRYVIGISLFILLVFLGVNTSSSGIYDSIIQPNQAISKTQSFWGVSRAIRSDEFVANTPVVLSQSLLGEFCDTNPNIMAANGSVLLFPKATTMSISVLANPYLLGFLFLDTIRGYSFYSLLQYFLAFFGIFELLLIVTKGNKILTLFGTLSLVFSPPMLWWNSFNHIAYPSICLVLLYHLMREDKKIKKLLLSVFIGWSGCCWVAILYPAWIIPFGYLFLFIAIWFILEAKRYKELRVKNFLYLFISLIIASIIFLPSIFGSLNTIELISNTVYPGARNSVGGNSWEYLFNWFSSPLYTLSDPGNPCEFSNFLCLYPLPTFLAIVQIIRNIKCKEIDWLLIFLTFYSIALSMWHFIPIGILSKLSLLYMSAPGRTAIVVGATNIFIIVRLLSNKCISSNFCKKRFIIAFVLSIILILIAIFAVERIHPDYYNKIVKLIFAIPISFILAFTLILNTENSRKIYIGASIAISLFLLISINPLSIGLNSIFNKPVSKEIHSITQEDPEGTWISANSSIYYSNFALANGAKILNSVNFYPQINVWKQIDNESKYSDIYNRYAHISFTLSTEETSFKLNQADYFTITLNIKDLRKLNIKYILSEDGNLSKYSNEGTTFIKLYEEDGANIYTIKYA